MLHALRGVKINLPERMQPSLRMGNITQPLPPKVGGKNLHAHQTFTAPATGEPEGNLPSLALLGPYQTYENTIKKPKKSCEERLHVRNRYRKTLQSLHFATAGIIATNPIITIDSPSSMTRFDSVPLFRTRIGICRDCSSRAIPARNRPLNLSLLSTYRSGTITQRLHQCSSSVVRHPPTLWKPSR